jgi:3-hydroxyisobutyrate dehydrogenase-like beta-hydroxyacid dehydrogenase
MNASALSQEIGVASAVKMCRSIVIKGLEALTLESMLAARRFGAEREVLESLNGTFPSMGRTGKLPDQMARQALPFREKKDSATARWLDAAAAV